MHEQLSHAPTQDGSAETLKIEDLQDLQIHIDLAAQDVRSYGETHLAHLNQLLTELDQKLEASDGLYVVGLPISGPRVSVNDKTLETSYSVGVDNVDNPVIYIPKECITAHQINPQFCGNGHDTMPVLNMRILRSPDQPAYDSNNQHIPDTEMWLQVPLNAASLAISYEPLAPAAA